MNIQGIQSYLSYELKAKPAKKKAVPKENPPQKRVKDTYEPAESEERRKLLQSVKKKIQSGYYNSEEVVEDLSEAFAKAFNQAL